ncbi:MAG: hypothetical protein O3B13_22665 [Planctomycetota bacterium]|nr:hypothetical protein [Planctomycetota bacterium]
MKNESWDVGMDGDMVIAGLSERTREAYLRAARQLAKFHHSVDPGALEEQQARDAPPRRTARSEYALDPSPLLFRADRESRRPEPGSAATSRPAKRRDRHHPTRGCSRQSPRAAEKSKHTSGTS